MKLSTWLTAALVSFSAAVTLAPDASAKVREDFEKVVPFSAGGQFSVKNSNGSITIKTWNEGSVRIEAEKSAKNEEYLKDIEIVIEGSGDSVSVETVHHRRRNGGSVSYVITLPVEADVNVRTANGSVNVEGVHGHLEAKSVNGSLKLEDIAGDIEASTTNGSIRAQYYAGAFEACVQQFELHRTVNPDDVENAVWHFLCMARKDGVEAARAALLPVGPDARVPMHQIYELFKGRMDTEAVLLAAKTEGPASRRKLWIFYADLYVGLYLEAVGDVEAARKHLDAAAKAGVGGYMGDVARVHATLSQ